MENQIIPIQNELWKTMVLKEDAIWLSSKNISNLERFERATQKKGLMRSTNSYKLGSIREVSFKEISDSVKLKYLDERGDQSKLTIEFGDKDKSNAFGKYLGEKLDFERTRRQEKLIKPFLLNAFFVIVAIGATFFLASMDDTNELTDGGGSRRNQGRRAILKLVVDVLGKTGVIIVGSLISVYLIYQLYNRLKNPAFLVVYRRVRRK